MYVITGVCVCVSPPPPSPHSHPHPHSLRRRPQAPPPASFVTKTNRNNWESDMCMYGIYKKKCMWRERIKMGASTDTHTHTKIDHFTRMGSPLMTSRLAHLFQFRLRRYRLPAPLSATASTTLHQLANCGRVGPAGRKMAPLSSQLMNAIDLESIG